jgi:hypothetical protein
MSVNVVRPTQTTFMQGRNILDGVLTLHETVHELHRKQMNGIILKIDFEKTYDKVKLCFLQHSLRMKGILVSGGLLSITLFSEEVLQSKSMILVNIS